MKVALCLSGNMRTYIECFPYLKTHLLDIYMPHIYIHTWNSLGCGQRGDYKHISTDIYSINSLYNPKSMVVEPLKNWKDRLDYKLHPGVLSHASVWGMYYGINKCNSMIKENYDIVIRCRPDLLFDRDLAIEIGRAHV